MAASIVPGINPAATATIGSATSSTASALGVDQQTIAGNFQTFLTLLTTQLQNQNPLDPLDTNQFTQQLVSFAQVEQQLRENDQLATLVSLQQTAQSTAALNFVGQTVVVDGATAQLANNQATWTFTSPKPATATITIQDSSGQTAYTGSYTLQAGPQSFVWDGKGNDGTQWPPGAYTMSITSKDASGQAVAISTEVQGVVDSVDLTQNPPLLSIGGQNFTINQIKRIVRS
ncbi:MAG TPA: flagellar hook capping FlgD N-terminal domain-containing protein [Xanthobacteraceae bacterium]|nr:flagellar hook capping FlgD N-terminal domain-containing protein [Xanthobacteraceae bacterium]